VEDWNWIEDRFCQSDPLILINLIKELLTTLDKLKEMVVGQQQQSKNMLIYNSALEMEYIINQVINKWKNGGK
jgi:hypothetical protein